MAVNLYSQQFDINGLATFDAISVPFNPYPVNTNLGFDVIIDSITDTTATLRWVTPTATSYIMTFGADGQNMACPPIGCTISDNGFATTRVVQLTGLTQSTVYSISVVAINAKGLQIPANDIVGFNTLQTAAAPPPPPPLDLTPPTIDVSFTSPVIDWDVNSQPVLSINSDTYQIYPSDNTQYIKIFFPNQPDTATDGSITVLPYNNASNFLAFDFNLYDPNLIGLVEIGFVAGNSIVGDGPVSKISINVQKQYRYEAPDITHIDYPYVEEADFVPPFQYNFDFKVSTINTDFIDVYIGNTTNLSTPLTKIGAANPYSTLSIKAADLYALKPTEFVAGTDGPGGLGDYYVITFTFIPYFNGINEKIFGTAEVVTVYVKRSQNKLTDTQVIDAIYEQFKKAFIPVANNLLVFDNDRYLQYHLKYQNSPFDSYVIANIAEDPNSFSLDTETGEIVPTEYIVDPETGNTTRKYPASSTLVVRLLEPLPGDIELNTQLWISKQLFPSTVEDIVITDQDVQICTPLQPNFSADVLDQTGYQYYNDIVASGNVTSTNIVNKYLSQSAFNLLDLAIDYTSGSSITGSEFLKFENFINFSSAKARVDNFQYKLSAIEFWENKITSSLYVGSTLAAGTYTTLTSQSYLDSIWRIKNGFDGFERKLYTNYSVTSSQASFFTYQSQYGDDYDRTNKNYLVNHLPTYLTQDNSNDNEEYILFLQMIGQHFDVLWSYIKGIHRTKIIRNSAEEGIPDKLVYTMLENLGWDGKHPFGGNQLWKEAFGLNANGSSFTNTNILGNSITPTYTPEEARKQVWRRLLNNLPYLLKHKGTKRSIYAIMACYGIPSSMLSIIEFGGTVPNANTNVNYTNFTYKTSTARLNVAQNSNILVPYYPASPPPTSVQVRFATDYQIPYSTSATGSQLVRMNVSGSNSYWQVNLVPNTTGSYGDVTFIIRSGSIATASLSITSSVIFDNEWKNLTIQKEQFQSASITYDRFTLYIKEASLDRLVMDQSASLILTSSTLTSVFTDTGSLYFGSYESTPGISGAFDEVRVWNSALSESVITAHALNPDVIYGNDVYSTTTNLLVRLDFEYAKDRNSDPYIKNVSPKVVYSGSTSIGGYTGYATASMGYTSTTYPYHYTPYERTATSTIPAIGFVPLDKIVNTTQELVGNLSYKQRATKKNTQVSSIDSNRLGIFFSPVKDLNLDILQSLGNISIGDYIGSWEDEYGKDYYPDLKRLKSYYFQRTNLDFSEYIKLIKSIDSSFYSMITQIPGQRVKLLTGLLIEPSILDRSKIKITKPSAEDIYHTASISFINNLDLNGEDQTLNAIFDQTDFAKTFESEISSLSSSIETSDIFVFSGENGTYSASYSWYESVGLNGESIYSVGSNGGSIEAIIDSKYQDATVIAEFELENSYENIGFDEDSPFVKGFGVFGQNGAIDRTYRRDDGTLVLTERNNAYLLTIKYTRDVPNTTIAGVTTYESVAKYEKKLLFVTQSDANAGGAFRSPSQHSFYTYITASLGTYPYDNGVVTSIQLFDGYTTGHYRFTKDTTKGLQNSYFNGSKQTSLTTLDGTNPVEIFSTNPNTLKVSNAGRGSGEPILEVT
jgi:hypothetical protein